MEMEMQQMEVTIPAGMKDGMQMQVDTPAGMMNVAIPEGKAEGDSFAFQYQAPAQLAVAVAMPVAPVAAVAAVPQAVQPQGLAAAPAREPATWKKGICSCCDHKDCGIVCCCATAGPFLMCAYPTIEGVAGVRQEAGGWIGECCIISGCPDVALSFCGLYGLAMLIGHFIMRRSVINKYNLIEGSCETYCCVFWCGPCAWCQQTNEMFEQENLVFDGCCNARREETSNIAK